MQINVSESESESNAEKLSNSVFDSFETNDTTEIDPDLQFFNDMTYINLSCICNYYSVTHKTAAMNILKNSIIILTASRYFI